MSDGQPKNRDVAGDPGRESAKGIGLAAADGKPLGFSTLAVHGGEPRPKLGNSLATPIVQTATYTFANTQELHDHFQRRIEREEYGRYGNPTQRIAEQKLAALEGAEDCLLFSSGMAAVTTTMFAVLSHNSHVVVTDDSYRRTRQFLTQVLHRYGIEVSVVPAGDYQAVEEAIRPTTRLLVSESPTNPYNRIVDLERFAEIGRRHRVKTLIDATFATPFNQRPLEFGIDLVLHSATKYLGGHNDLLAGAVLGGAALVDGIRSLQHVTGPILDPLAAYLLVRGLKTFGLRVERQNANAQALAEFLAAHPKVVGRSLCRFDEPPGARSGAPPDARFRRCRVFRGRRRSGSDLASGRCLPDSPDCAVVGRSGKFDRAAGADELLRAQHGRTPDGRHQR